MERLTHTQDAAFLDRVDIKQFVPNPSIPACYEIFRSCLNELIRCNLLTESDISEDASDAGSADSAALANAASKWNLVDHPIFPSYEEVNIHLWNQPHAPGTSLLSIAHRCEVRAMGLSAAAYTDETNVFAAGSEWTHTPSITIPRACTAHIQRYVHRWRSTRSSVARSRRRKKRTGGERTSFLGRVDSMRWR